MNRRTLLKLLAVVPFAQIPSSEYSQRVAVLGDWGAGNKTQRQVAEALLKVHEKTPLTAVFSTGDNIYPKGVQSTTDTHWLKFSNVYDKSLLSLPWFISLGNHDWRGNVQAQIDYNSVHKNWILPHRYFHQTIPLGGRTIDVIVVDTTALLQGDESQEEWLKSVFSTVSKPWVIGHHPIRSYGYYGDNDVLLNKLAPLLNQARTELYLCGHDHDLQYIRHPDDTFHCVVSGAGATTRATHKGPHSFFAAATPGFAVLEVSHQHVKLQFFDKSVSILFEQVLL